MSLRRALDASKPLHGTIREGKQALRAADRERVEERHARVLDSLDLETALPARAPSTKRWDYLLGTTDSGVPVCGREVHLANTGEARVIVAKKRDTEQDLKPYLATGQSIRRWYWVASGATKITRNTPEARLLDRAGITLVGSRLVLGP